MKERMGRFLTTYIQENMSLLFLIAVIFVIGIVAGAFTVNALDSGQKGELYNYINGFLESKEIKISQAELFGQIFLNYAKLILLIWFLGVTIVGLPLIFGLIGFKGFTIGFSVGFMLDVFTDLRGILIVISSILPQTLIVLPCLVILSISSIRLSLSLLRGGEQKRQRVNETKVRLISHTAVSILMMLVIAIGALLESLILPMFLNIISSHYYSGA